MPRHADSGNREIQPPGYLDVNSGKGDGNSDSPVEDVVEEAIARIVIVLRVASESVGLKESGIDLLDSGDRRVGRTQFPLDGRCNSIEQIQIGAQLELRIFLTGHDQRGFGQRDRGIRQRYELLERLA